MSIGRHKCRVAAVKMIFGEEFRKQGREELLEMVIEREKPSEAEREFVMNLVEQTFANLDEIKGQIAEHAPERPIDEISRINRAILYLGAYEVLHEEETPAAVAINEAVEVARELSNETGIAFVNGVLNKIYEESEREKLKN